MEQDNDESHAIAEAVRMTCSVAPITNADLKELVKEIFNIIPSYYDEKEAAQTEVLISNYVKKKLEQRQ